MIPDRFLLADVTPARCPGQCGMAIGAGVDMPSCCKGLLVICAQYSRLRCYAPDKVLAGWTGCGVALLEAIGGNRARNWQMLLCSIRISVRCSMIDIRPVEMRVGPHQATKDVPVSVLKCLVDILPDVCQMMLRTARGELPDFAAALAGRAGGNKYRLPSHNRHHTSTMDHLVIEHLNRAGEKEMADFLATSTKHEAGKVLVAKMRSFIRCIQCRNKGVSRHYRVVGSCAILIFLAIRISSTTFSTAS